MKLTNLLVIVAACVAGFLGGMLALQVRVKALPPAVLRASRFELVDTAGKPVARWEVDSEKHQVHLCFLSKGGPIGLDIGVSTEGQPFLAMNGRDGKPRIDMGLGWMDKPALGMGDERWQGRIVLGHAGSDTPDILDDPWDQWGLEFRPFGSERPIAAMGMTMRGGNQTKGILMVDGKSVR
ncbi:MAG: hypothetical protein WBL61_15775 [Bryobacteraceae bacterium]